MTLNVIQNIRKTRKQYRFPLKTNVFFENSPLWKINFENVLKITLQRNTYISYTCEIFLICYRLYI